MKMDALDHEQDVYSHKNFLLMRTCTVSKQCQLKISVVFCLAALSYSFDTIPDKSQPSSKRTYRPPSHSLIS